MSTQSKKRKTMYRTYSKSKRRRLNKPNQVAFPRARHVPVLNRATCVKTICGYSEFVSLDPSIASLSAYVFSLNGLYDPNITGGGQQPTGFDQYMALYDEYLVMKAHVTIKVVNTDATNAQLVGATITGYDATTTDANVYLRNNNYWHTILAKAGGNDTGSYSFTVDLNELFYKNIFNEADVAGIVTRNPIDQWYLQIWACPADGTSNAGVTLWTVKIDYYTLFRDPATTLSS